MIITLDLYWSGVNLKPDEPTEWLGYEDEGADAEAGAAIDRAYADVVGQQMEDDFGILTRTNEALDFCGRLSMMFAHPVLGPFAFHMNLDLNIQGQAQRGTFLLPPTSVDSLAERLGHPGYHMTGDLRLPLLQRPDVKAPYRRTRSRHVVFGWNKGKHEDVRMHFPVLFPFDDPLSPAVVYTSWMDLATALSVLIERRKRLKMT